MRKKKIGKYTPGKKTKAKLAPEFIIKKHLLTCSSFDAFKESICNVLSPLQPHPPRSLLRF